MCASGSAVEHNLAKVGVAGSIPVSRSEKAVIPNGIAAFFRVQSWTRRFDVYTSFRSAQNRGPPDLVRRLALEGKGLEMLIYSAFYYISIMLDLEKNEEEIAGEYNIKYSKII